MFLFIWTTAERPQHCALVNIKTVLKTVQFQVKKPPTKLEASNLKYVPEASPKKCQNLEFLTKKCVGTLFCYYIDASIIYSI